MTTDPQKNISPTKLKHQLFTVIEDERNAGVLFLLGNGKRLMIPYVWMVYVFRKKEELIANFGAIEIKIRVPAGEYVNDLDSLIAELQKCNVEKVTPSTKDGLTISACLVSGPDGQSKDF